VRIPGWLVAGRTPALVALVLLGACLLAVIVLSTPWRTLPPVPEGATAVSAARDFGPAEIDREEAFHSSLRPVSYASLLLGLVVAALLGLTPLGARLVAALARPLGGGWGWQVVLGGLAVSLIGWLAALPLSARRDVVLRRYGLSTQTWSSWWTDQVKGLAVGAVLMLVVLLVLYGLIRAFPRGWWLPASVSVALLVVLTSFVYPLLVEPVFNKFTPMPEGPLRSSLIALADADGVPVRDVLVADASRRTNALNAYVSGFGATRRIVVYDTTVEKASEDEVRLIVAHELGHAKRNDVLHGTLIAALGLAAGVVLLYLLLGWGPLLRRAGVHSAADGRSVALVLLLVTVVGTLAGPVQNLVSRRIEARADVHALDLTREPDPFARMQRRLAVTNLSDLDPNPVQYGLFSSHPTAPERIALARDWARLHGVPPPPDLASR
jgi:STE24 endopeptidase